MGLGDFFLDGGLLGMLRGYDHEEEGRPYGFAEFDEDIQPVMDMAHKMGYLSNIPGFDLLDEE